MNPNNKHKEHRAKVNKLNELLDPELKMARLEKEIWRDTQELETAIEHIESLIMSYMFRWQGHIETDTMDNAAIEFNELVNRLKDQ